MSQVFFMFFILLVSLIVDSYIVYIVFHKFHKNFIGTSGKYLLAFTFLSIVSYWVMAIPMPCPSINELGLPVFLVSFKKIVFFNLSIFITEYFLNLFLIRQLEITNKFLEKTIVTLYHLFFVIVFVFFIQNYYVNSKATFEVNSYLDYFLSFFNTVNIKEIVLGEDIDRILQFFFYTRFVVFTLSISLFIALLKKRNIKEFTPGATLSYALAIAFQVYNLILLSSNKVIPKEVEAIVFILYEVFRFMFFQSINNVFIKKEGGKKCIK